jgi:RHS repeat-associated protein
MLVNYWAKIFWLVLFFLAVYFQIEYNYDKLDRLTGVSYPDGGSINYSYDAMNNRVEKVTADGTTIYSYNELNQLTSAGDINYEYDKEGKLIKKETPSETFDYEYNDYDRLAKVKKGGAEVASYKYDPRGKRVSVTEEGNTTEYLWQGNSLLASYVNGSREKLYAVGNRMDEVLGVYGNNTSYLHSNHLGSIKGVTGTDGSVKGTRSYTPYGVMRETTGSFNTDLGFIGRRQSDVTGLTYIRARYYDASAGRFTKIDPMQDGLNWYGYAGGNPVKYVDRTGKFLTLGTATLTGTVAGGVIGGVTEAIKGGDAGDIVQGAISGAAGGFVAGAAVDTGGASLGVMVAGEAAGAAVDSTIDQTLDKGSLTKVDPKQVAKDSAIAATTAGVVNYGASKYFDDLARSHFHNQVDDMVEETSKFNRSQDYIDGLRKRLREKLIQEGKENVDKGDFIADLIGNTTNGNNWLDRNKARR